MSPALPTSALSRPRIGTDRCVMYDPACTNIADVDTEWLFTALETSDQEVHALQVYFRDGSVGVAAKLAAAAAAAAALNNT